MKSALIINNRVSTIERDAPNIEGWYEVSDTAKEGDIFNPELATRDDNLRTELPSIHDLIVALWEKIIEKRPEAADALQLKRIEVKSKYPKP